MKDIEKFYKTASEDEDEIDTKIRLHKEQAVNLINSNTLLTDEMRLERYRLEILFEIYESECTYVRDLDNVIKVKKLQYFHFSDFLFK